MDRVKKSNLPPQAPSPLLSDYLGATWSELSAATTQKNWYSNTPKEQLVAMQALKKAQQEGLITIKQADKGGGWVVGRAKILGATGANVHSIF